MSELSVILPESDKWESEDIGEAMENHKSKQNDNIMPTKERKKNQNSENISQINESLNNQSNTVVDLPGFGRGGAWQWKGQQSMLHMCHFTFIVLLLIRHKWDFLFQTIVCILDKTKDVLKPQRHLWTHFLH